MCIYQNPSISDFDGFWLEHLNAALLADFKLCVKSLSINRIYYLQILMIIIIIIINYLYASGEESKQLNESSLLIPLIFLLKRLK